MKILILTPINPVLCGDVFKKVYKKLDGLKNVDVFSYSVAAEILALKDNKSFIVAFFAMAKAALGDKTQKLLNRKDHSIMVGNTYKDEEFDMIVAVDTNYNDISDEFDTYLATVKHDENMDEFRELVNVENLYTLEDAEVILPTVEHLLLFIEGVVDNEFKQKSIRSS